MVATETSGGPIVAVWDRTAKVLRRADDPALRVDAAVPGAQPPAVVTHPSGVVRTAYPIVADSEHSEGDAEPVELADLTEWLANTGLSRDSAAERLGIGVKSLRKILNGEVLMNADVSAALLREIEELAATDTGDVIAEAGE